ncbi:UNVERIFIED_ORG: hypothetical protein M2328_006781 [Rhodococcus erythropolis]
MTSDAPREAAAIAHIEGLWSVVAPISQKVADHSYIIAPSSALQLDHDNLPTLQVATSVDRALNHGLHHMKGLQRLLQSGDLPQYVPYTLVRSAIESAAAAVWLLDDNATTRMQRRMALELDEVNEAHKAAQAAGVGHQDIADQRKQQAFNALALAGLKKDDCQWRGYSAVIRAVDPYKNSTKSLELAWRACSGMAHGKFWAVPLMTPQTNTISLNSTTKRATFTPSLHTLAIVLDRAVDMLLRADGLYETRRAPMV